MRIAFTLVVACVAVAACASSHDLSPTPPTVFFYNVTGNNVSQANVRAESYCARFGRTAVFQGLQPGQSGNVAVYSCAGATTAGGEPAPPAGSSGASGSPTRLTH